MKQKLRDMKCKLIALWWFITRKNFYLLSYNDRTGKILETYNVVLPEFIEWAQKKHGMMTSTDIIWELQDIGICLEEPRDILAYNRIKDLIARLQKERE